MTGIMQHMKLVSSIYMMQMTDVHKLFISFVFAETLHVLVSRYDDIGFNK